MYDVRTMRNGSLRRESLASVAEVCLYLRSLTKDDKLIGVFQVSVSEKGVTTSREIPCFVEGDLVVLGKPM